MKRIVSAVLVFITSLVVARAEEAPAADSTTNAPYTALSAEEIEKQVLKPPPSKAPISTMPTLYDGTTTPPLTPEAQKRQYLGFRLGMSLEEATLLAKTAGKSLDEVEKDRRYMMEGALADVPRPDKARTILVFNSAKLLLITMFWDDDRILYNNLQPMLEKKYGKSLKADELFRRYWILENDDAIRLLYDVSAHQTSLVYGNKNDVYELSEKEKRELTKEYKGL